ncbi:MAG: hypothetical protein JRJ08_00920 [Deltaproteobacteria bacterium]|nr:hypothetical protein [Deltaproteobacteria bacterium]
MAMSGINSLDDGLYHSSIAHHGLFPLRKGTLFPHIVKMTIPAGSEVPFLTFDSMNPKTR